MVGSTLLILINLIRSWLGAYFLRGAAFGDLGDSHNAVSDLTIAVGLDPSLDHYISTKGKTASIALPPW